MGLLELPFEAFEFIFLFQNVMGVSPLPRCKSTSNNGTFESNFIGLKGDTGSFESRL